MKAISLWQPWASLWVLRIKKDETRSWEFPKWYTGPVAIHAAQKRIKLDDIDEYYLEGILKGLNIAGLEFGELPRGKFIGVCDSIASDLIIDYQKDELEDMLGDWKPGRYAWKPGNMRPLPEPIPFTGRQRIFNVDDHIILGGSDGKTHSN